MMISGARCSILCLGVFCGVLSAAAAAEPGAAGERRAVPAPRAAARNAAPASRPGEAARGGAAVQPARKAEGSAAYFSPQERLQLKRDINRAGKKIYERERPRR